MTPDFKKPSAAAVDAARETFVPANSNLEGAMQGFSTGATRSADTDKPDFEGYMSPLVMEGFGAYMLKHTVQADGKRRASDNWQKGIPQFKYFKSLFRHFHAIWKLHRKTVWNLQDGLDMRENIYAAIFNLQGYAHEFELGRDTRSDAQ